MDDLKSIPYIVFEASEAKSERTIKRLIIALVISIFVGFLTNLAWLWVWNQYEYVDETSTETRVFTQDGNGLNIIGDSNEVTHEPNSDLYEDAEASD